MSNNKDFKVKNGIQPTSYYEGVGTVVSGAEGYYLSEASYDSVSFNTQAQDSNQYGLAFSSDGSTMYTSGYTNDNIYQYTLSTAWDISTASYSSVSFNVASQDSTPLAVSFKDDGIKMYVIGLTNRAIYQYSLSTAWDLSTASYDSVSFSVSTQTTRGFDVRFGDSGSKMYVTADNNNVYQYSLSTAWDISSASYDSKTLATSSQTSASSASVFNASGTEMFVVCSTNQAIYKYSLSTAWDISTASYASVSYSVATQITAPVTLFFKADGAKLYILEYSGAEVYQYSTTLNTAELDLSTGSVFDYTPTSDVQVTLSNPAASGTVSQATLLLNQEGAGGYDLLNIGTVTSFSVLSQGQYPYGFFMKPDGTKMYIAVNSDDSIDQYSLSTAYDISTASYDSVTLDVSSQDVSPESLWFKPDGTKMYYAGSSGDTVDQYALSTAWDLSTASYESKQLSVSGQMIAPRSIAFNPDGTKLLIAGESNIGGQPADGVWQYTLSTAWDISTASYDSSNLNVGSQSSAPYGIDFNSDGSKMFILDSGGTVYQYSLSSAYTLSGASYDSVSGSTTLTSDIRFVNSGKTLVGIDVNNSEVESYPSSTPATITYDSTLQWPTGTAPTAPAIGETDVITFNTSDGGTTYNAVQAIDGAA
jgi:sugar lactone lactonase YvrE